MSDLGKHLNEKAAVYEEHFRNGDFDRASAFYTADCRLISPGKDVQIGREAVKDLLNSYRAKGIQSLRSKADELLGKQGDEYVSVRGHYDALSGSGEVIHKGRFVSVFKLVDGDYFCHLDAECA